MSKNLIFTDRTLLLLDVTFGNAETALKQAAIVFDKLFYYTPDHVSPFLDVGENLKFILQNTCRSLRRKDVEKLFIASSSFMRDFEDDYRSKSSSLGIPQLDEESGNQLVELIRSYEPDTLGDYQAIAGPLPPSPLHEGLYHTMENLTVESGMSIYISKFLGDFNILSSPAHLECMSIVHKINPLAPTEVMGKIANGLFFDFSKLDWSDIIKLRRSGFCQSFRLKFKEWLSLPSIGDDSTKLIENINKDIFSSQFRFIRRHRAEPPKKMISAVLSNLPTPFPNPFSAFESFQATKGVIKDKREFGWLMFLADLDSRINRSDD